MKKILVTATLIVATASSLVSAQESAPTPEQQVRQTYDALFTAFDKRDVVALNRYISPDALFSDGNGKITTKQELFKDLPKPGSASAKHKNEKNRRVISVKASGDHAILVNRIWYSDGKQVDTKVTTTIVFVKRDQDWQLVTATTIVDAR